MQCKEHRIGCKGANPPMARGATFGLPQVQATNGSWPTPEPSSPFQAMKKLGAAPEPLGTA